MKLRSKFSLGIFVLIICQSLISQEIRESKTRVHSIEFKTHDGYEMFGKLALPASGELEALVIYVQTSEGMTVDMKRPLGGNRTFKYHDLYRKKFPEKNIGFFSYQGRGISMGDSPPRYEKIEKSVFNTGTLDNKVKDIISAIEIIRLQPKCDNVPIILMGASEGSLLAAEAASRQPDQVSGLVLYGILVTNLKEVFKYIMSDGSFLIYRIVFDANMDNKVTEEEFIADPYKFRANTLKNAEFKAMDPNSDGVFTVDDIKMMTKPYLDAVKEKNYEVLQSWAEKNAGVSIPDGWFQDHFDHDSIWEYLKKLDIPIGLFHGDRDTNTPISELRKLEKMVVEKGRTNMKYFYFNGLDHSLNITQYFLNGQLPDGHKSIFKFVDKIVADFKSSRP